MTSQECIQKGTSQQARSHSSSHCKATRRKVTKKADLDLREIMLLDNQSTSDLFCNEKMATKTRKSQSKMRLRSDGGGMQADHKAPEQQG